jgi:hypothetical protein
MLIWQPYLHTIQQKTTPDGAAGRIKHFSKTKSIHFQATGINRNITIEC